MKIPRIRLGTLLLLVAIAALSIALYTDRRRVARLEADRQHRAELESEFASWTVHARNWAAYADSVEAKAAEMARGELFAGSSSITGWDPAEATGSLDLAINPGDSAARLREIARSARGAAARCAHAAERCAAERKSLPAGL